MKKFIFTLAAFMLAIVVNAQTAREEIKANKYLSGSQYLDLKELEG